MEQPIQIQQEYLHSLHQVTYDVTVKDAAGCISAATQVTINGAPGAPAAPTASATLQPTCAVPTGTITVTAPTGAGLTYSIDGTTYTNTTIIYSRSTRYL